MAPGGDPVGVVPNGASSLRYGLTGRDGIVATDTGRTLTGSGETLPVRGAGRDRVGLDDPRRCAARSARRAVRGRAGAATSPPTVASIFDAQVDLDREGTSGTRHLSQRRARSRPPPSSPSTTRSRAIVRSADLGAIEQLPSLRSSRRAGCRRRMGGTTAPAPGTRGGVDGVRAPTGELEGVERRDRPAARGVRLVDGRSMLPPGSLRVRFADQWVRTCGDPRARSALAGGVVDHPEAGGAMRSERHAASADTRPGTGPALARRARRGRRRRVRAPAWRRPAAPEPAPRSTTQLRRVVLSPRRGTEAMEGHAVPRESRRLAPVVARVTSLLGEEAGDAAGRHRAAAGDGRPCRFPPRAGRPRRTSSTSMGGSRRRGSRRAAVERSASARSRARRRPRRTWFAPDGTTEQGEDAYLVVMNPFAVDAVFDVVLFTPKRAPIRSSAADRSRASPRQERGVPAERVRRRRSGRRCGGRRLARSRGRVVARASRATAGSGA